MLSDKILHLLNKQTRMEGEASQLYLSMHTWACKAGLEGTAKWFLDQSNEERAHMLKILVYINDRGPRASITQLDSPKQDFGGCKEVFEATLEHEIKVTESLQELKKAAMAEGDSLTCTFLIWFLDEQIEEEANVRRILDRINLGDDTGTSKILVDSYIGKLR